MKHVNLNNQSTRRILRKSKRENSAVYRVSYHADDLPDVIPRWSPMDTRHPFEADIVALLQSTDEYQNVTMGFFQSVKEAMFKIHHIYRVQNLNLYKKYMAMKAEMKQQYGEEPRELSLFHGTPDIDTVRCICNQSFDFRLSGQYGSKYGDGAYFATRASFSSHYTQPSPVKARRYMFQADVLVYSIFNSDQSYPTYLIEYDDV
ncbi:hypothetical protein CAPTEDRAFT_214494 [Capitella teleta]|uniref:Poly [ADP-ribose] polymerase n=1 Tax=Capitella teleta TaxID=283909 RepID=R7V3A8_CAPTE|nr:hypothetical protein CAPTEDRAFT_214494 [Capitella teleta]|eukprot:ELU13328.1 hypothetical protein CAPTEDRAFT_214494 [Capitella teleta]